MFADNLSDQIKSIDIDAIISQLNEWKAEPGMSDSGVSMIDTFIDLIIDNCEFD